MKYMFLFVVKYDVFYSGLNIYVQAISINTLYSNLEINYSTSQKNKLQGQGRK